MPSGPFDDQNGPLLADSDKLNTADARIAASQRLALETEQLGMAVLADLRRQREQLERAGHVLNETDADLDRSNKLIRDILRRMAANRLITTALIVLLAGAILLTIYYKLFH